VVLGQEHDGSYTAWGPLGWQTCSYLYKSVGKPL
jgi:hypothetical protein